MYDAFYVPLIFSNKTVVDLAGVGRQRSTVKEWRRNLCVGLLLSLAAGACWRGAKAGSGPLRPREHITRTSLVVFATSIRIPTYPHIFM